MVGDDGVPGDRQITRCVNENPIIRCLSLNIKTSYILFVIKYKTKIATAACQILFDLSSHVNLHYYRCIKKTEGQN